MSAEQTINGVWNMASNWLMLSLVILDRTWWRQKMIAFSALLALYAGNSPVTGEFPTQKPVTQNFDVFYLRWINGWVNNGAAGDLRRHHPHYDVIVMHNEYCTGAGVICHTGFWSHVTDGNLHRFRKAIGYSVHIFNGRTFAATRFVHGDFKRVLLF